MNYDCADLRLQDADTEQPQANENDEQNHNPWKAENEANGNVNLLTPGTSLISWMYVSTCQPPISTVHSVPSFRLVGGLSIIRPNHKSQARRRVVPAPPGSRCCEVRPAERPHL